MKTFHTIVVGAGPGGLSCATMLARNGAEVLLVERKKRVGPKVCAGGVTWGGFSRHIPEHLIERSFNTQQIFTNWQKTSIVSHAPIISTVNRERLGQWMLEEAVTAGVKFMKGTHVRHIHNSHIVTDKGDFGFQNLVGADGSSSLVRKHLGIPSPNMGIGIQCHVDRRFDAMEWHLNTNLFGNGYAWIFPHKNQASVGIYAMRNTIKPKALQKTLYQWAQKHGIDLGRCRLEAALINFDYQGWQFDNFYLVGDAAGLASALTGEGIYPAIISGEAVAQAITNENSNGKKLDRLLQNHSRHLQFLKLSAKGKRRCTLLMESLVLALRLGILDFSVLEMGS